MIIFGYQIKDNAFAYARLWFKNMDKLIEVMNEHAGLELTHSCVWLKIVDNGSLSK